MWTGVQVITKPADLPVSLADTKGRLEVDSSDWDAKITSMIKGAVARIDGPSGIGYALMVQTWRKTFDCFPAMIKLPGAPIKSVTSIKYLDAAGVEQTLDAADYRADFSGEPARIVPAIGKAWPATSPTIGAVWVDYVLGEADADDVLADLIDAVYLTVGHRFENRTAVVMGQSSELPLGVRSILVEHNRVAVTA